MRIQNKFFIFTTGAAMLVIVLCSIHMLNGARAYEDDRLFHKMLATESLLSQIATEPSAPDGHRTMEQRARLVFEDPEIIQLTLTAPGGDVFVDLRRLPPGEAPTLVSTFIIRRGATHLADAKIVFTKALIQEKLNQLGMTMVYLASLITLVLAFAYSAITRAFWRPFSQIIEAMRQVDEGDYSVSVDMGGRDEYGEIARYFNTMVESIRVGNDQIRAYAAELEANTRRLEQEIEEREATEEALRRAQKMEAIARLAGGVAHDFNNLLTSILGFSVMVLDELEEGHPARGDMEEVVRAGERARNLTQQLLALGRKQPLQMRRIDVNNILKGLDNLLRRTLASDIELVVLLGEGLGSVRADPGSLEQVIVNLVLNGRDAMPSGGKLVVSTSRVKPDSAKTARLPGGSADSYIRISVQDTGAGIPQDVLERIFEPFFTTKREGTGLGLSTAYGIVRQCGGDMEVESRVGEGTTFRIYLPAEDKGSDAVPVLVEEKVVGGSETILLVEDEDSVRRLAARVLRRLGYRVLEARYGTEGLEMAQQHDGSIDLVLSDVVMPQLSGPDMVAKLRERNEGFKVLYMTGYAQDRSLVGDGAGRAPQLILKPFTREALARIVRKVLDQT